MFSAVISWRSGIERALVLLSTIIFRTAFRSPGATGLAVFCRTFFFSTTSPALEVEKGEMADGRRYRCGVFAPEILVAGAGLSKHFQHVLEAIAAEE